MNFNRRGNAMPSRKIWAKRLPFLKDVISLIKDALDISWRIAPITVLGSGLMLWSFLREIGWADLFGDSAFSASGLFFLVIAAVILAFALLLLFLAPSVMMIVTGHLFNFNGFSRRDVFVMYLGSVTGWTLAMIWTLVSSGSWWTLFAFPMIVVCFLGAVHASGRWRHAIRTERLKMLSQILGIAGSVTVSVVFTTYPLLLVLQFISSESAKYSDLVQYALLVPSLIVSFIGLFPGYVYLRAQISRSGSISPFKQTFAAATDICVIVLMMVFQFSPVSSFVLNRAGVYRNEISTFQVIDKDLIKIMKGTGLKVDEVKGLNIVTAYVRYNFGVIRLLCTTKYVAAYTVEKSKNMPDARSQGMGCVRTQSNEIRRFTATGNVTEISARLGNNPG